MRCGDVPVADKRKGLFGNRNKTEVADPEYNVKHTLKCKDSLSAFDTEIASVVHEINNRQKALDIEIKRDRDEKRKLEEAIAELQERLTNAKDVLDRNERLRDDLEKTLVEAKASYGKIVENSHDLLAAVKRDANLKPKEPEMLSLEAFSSRIMDEKARAK